MNLFSQEWHLSLKPTKNELMDLLNDKIEHKLTENICKKTTKRIMRMKKKNQLIKLGKHKKKILKMLCFMNDENGFDNTCKKMG